MDYLTLKKHISYLSNATQSHPMVIRAFDSPGRSISLRLKFSDKIADLNICLDSPNQGIRLTDKSTEIEKNSSIVRNLNRLLTNSRLASIKLAGDENAGCFDRVVKIHFILIDEYFGHRSDYFMFCEFTGRIADSFICDSDLKIIDRMSRTSNNLIGQPYKMPDSCKLLNPDTTEDSKLLEIFSSPEETWLDKIGCISPLLTKEIFCRAQSLPYPTQQEKYLCCFKEILKETDSNNSVWLYKADNKLKAISAYKLNHSDNLEKIEFQDVNSAMNYVEDSLNGPKRLDQDKKRIISLLNRDLKQKKQLLTEQYSLKDKYNDSEKYQELGNIITANIYRIKPGSTKLEAEDWNTGNTITIELDPTRTPAANAKKYFNLYKKAKRGIIEVEKRILSLQSDIKWFEEQIWLADNASTESWLQIEENTKTDRQNRKSEQSNKNKSNKKSKPNIKPELETNGCKYYIGHNAKQNDQITFQIGKKGDIWFHANDVPGAHVILKKPEGPITEEDILLGAKLAATNSFAKNSSKTAVDYTDVSNVKRIPNGGLGHVFYVSQHTIIVSR